MGLLRPVLLDSGITKVADFLQHGREEGGAQVAGVCIDRHPIVLGDKLAATNVVVESRQSVQEVAATRHIPARKGMAP